MEPRKPRILMSSGIFPPDIGGPATYAELLLQKLPERGFEIKILTYGEKKAGDWPAVIRVSRNWPKGIRHFFYLMNCFRWAGRANIVFAQNTLSAGWPAMLAAKLFGRKYIIRIVGDEVWEQSRQRFNIHDSIDDFQKKKYGWLVTGLRFLQKTAAHSADLIIVPSHYLKGIVLGWGVGENKVKVIHNACHLPEVNPVNAVSQTKLLFSAGRLVPWKGFAVLISAVQELLAEKNIDLRLIIAGDGPDRAELESLAADRFKDKIVFTGVLDKKQLVKYLAAANIFVLNTGYEGFSHQILEAMSLGVPVITTTAGGNPELIKEGESGFLISYNDKDALKKKILELVDNPEMGKRLGERGKAAVAQFSQERLLKEITAVFVNYSPYVCLTIHTERLHDDKLWQQIKKMVKFFNRQGIQATWFAVNPTFIGFQKLGFDERKWIERLKYLAEHDQLIEQHTHFYKEGKGDYDLSPEHLRKRLTEDKKWLEKQGSPVEGFVSGGWRVNENILKILNELNYRYDCTARTSEKKHLWDRDHLICSQPEKHGSLWEIPTTDSVKEMFLTFGGSGSLKVLYCHDYDLGVMVVRAALRSIIWKKNQNFISTRDLISYYEDRG